MRCWRRTACALRAPGELVRVVDDEGRLLWIDRSKTMAGRRKLEVPTVLRPFLLELAEGKSGTEPLFPSQRREWVRIWVRRICEIAGVPKGIRTRDARTAVRPGARGRGDGRAGGEGSGARARVNHRAELRLGQCVGSVQVEASPECPTGGQLMRNGCGTIALSRRCRQWLFETLIISWS